VTTMIERAARAIADAQDVSEPFDNYEEMARAAIAAMREPTEAMLEASPVSGPVSIIWQNMIDAALEEK
jgi:hypothetical protein